MSPYRNFLAGLGEIVLPVLLALGLGTRFAALGILGMTMIIQLTVPDGLTNFHLLWFAMALALWRRRNLGGSAAHGQGVAAPQGVCTPRALT